MMVKFIILFFWSIILIFLFSTIFILTIDLVQRGKKSERQYYKRFLEVLKDRDLYKHTFPKMSYEQIINLYELPEANAEGCVMDFTMRYLANEDKDGVLVLYVRKENYHISLQYWLTYRYERENNGIILFVPKSYKDYKRLYDYFYNKGKKQKEDEITNAQLESLRYLKSKINDTQDRSVDTLKKCQKENTEIADRITNKSSIEEDRNLLKLQYVKLIQAIKNSNKPLSIEDRYNLAFIESQIRSTFEIREYSSNKR